jgi:hypothetical protein
LSDNGEIALLYKNYLANKASIQSLQRIKQQGNLPYFVIVRSRAAKQFAIFQSCKLSSPSLQAAYIRNAAIPSFRHCEECEARRSDPKKSKYSKFKLFHILNCNILIFICFAYLDCRASLAMTENRHLDDLFIIARSAETKQFIIMNKKLSHYFIYNSVFVITKCGLLPASQARNDGEGAMNRISYYYFLLVWIASLQVIRNDREFLAYFYSICTLFTFFCNAWIKCF